MAATWFDEAVAVLAKGIAAVGEVAVAAPCVRTTGALSEPLLVNLKVEVAVVAEVLPTLAGPKFALSVAHVSAAGGVAPA